MKKLFKKLSAIKKLFKGGKKISPKRILVVLIPAIIIIAVVVLSQTGLDWGALTSKMGEAAKSVTRLAKPSYLTYDKAVFARVTAEGEVQFPEDKVFVHGEDIHFALMNVGKFQKDEEGKNWVDMDLIVIGPDNKVLMDKKNLLGESGHLELKDDTAPSPSGVFVAGSDMKSGKYTMKLRVYDKIGGGEVSDSGTFELK